MTTKEVVELLGGPDVLADIESHRGIIEALRRGFPHAVVDAVLRTTQVDPRAFWDAFGATPEDVSETPILSKEQSEFLLNVARAYYAAVEVFEDNTAASKWLVTACQPLDDVPLYLLDTTVGYEAVADEIARISHGVLG